MPGRKIATCCYCGSRAALVLRGDLRHELSCAACGAPLHDLKALPRAQVKDRPPQPQPSRDARHAPPPRPKKRRRKSLSRKLISEAFDLIEDIFD